jgi:hypothetical protein
MQGMAADIEIQGVSAVAIRDFAYGLGNGGVGFYGQHRFVHVDSGVQRTWGWKPGPDTRSAVAVQRLLRVLSPARR